MTRTWIAALTGSAVLALAACSPSPDATVAPTETATPSPEPTFAPLPTAEPTAFEPEDGAVIDETTPDDERGNDTGRRL